MSNDARTFAHTSAHAIAKVQAADGVPGMILVVTARMGSVLEIDSSTVMVGHPDDAPALVMEFAHRLRPAIEAVARELAAAHDQPFERRADLEEALGEPFQSDDEGALS